MIAKQPTAAVNLPLIGRLVLTIFYPQKTLNKPTTVQIFIKFRRCMLNISLQTTPGCECCQAETEICTCQYEIHTTIDSLPAVSVKQSFLKKKKWLYSFRHRRTAFHVQIYVQMLQQCVSKGKKIKLIEKKCTRLRVRRLLKKSGLNQMNYIVSDWLNKMALCFHALAMCTRPIFSENGKLAFRHRGTASHMCKTGQTRSFTPKNRFQVVLKAVVHLVAIVVKTGQDLG